MFICKNIWGQSKYCFRDVRQLCAGFDRHLQQYWILGKIAFKLPISYLVVILPTITQRHTMATVEKLSIALTHEMADEVRTAVKSGDYASSSEVIREALRDWRRKRALQDQEINELRGLWHEGLESGEGQYGSMQEIKQSARKRLVESDQ